MDRQLRLQECCARGGIELVDPAPFLLARMRAGESVYDNHFSTAGHRAFADAFVAAFIAGEATSDERPGSARR